jgi:general secretion pathway protein A
MYTAFFRLKHDPFSIAPDPRYLFMSDQHREALAHLLYGVAGGGGFVLLTGEIGAGKTTVCRCFLEQIPRRCNVAYIFNPKQSVEELMKSVCDEFRIPYQHTGPGVPTVKDFVDALNEFLLRTHAVGQNSVLIIDEAQNLSLDVLEQLRLLTNLETNQRKLLQIILIGQPELRSMLAQPKMEQLAQRIIARFHLKALSRADTLRYIDHRLTVAGLRAEPPFTRAALKRIHAISRGVPRRINLLCDRALLGAYAQRKARVDLGIVNKAAREVFVTTIAAADAPSPLRRAALVGSGALASVLLFGAIALALDPGVRQRLLGNDETANPAPRSTLIPPPASVPNVPAASSVAPVELTAVDLSTKVPPGLRDEPGAWRALAALWKLPVTDGNPCGTGEGQQIQCFKATTTLTLIRQLDRPGFLTLYDDADRPVYVLLSGLSDQGAHLRVGDASWTVTVASLARLWRGEFATFWRPPPGYAGAPVKAGAGAAADWLASRLAPVLGVPAADRPMHESDLKAMIMAFQAAQGLKADGLAGPMTLMQVNRASGIDEPRLNSDH